MPSILVGGGSRSGKSRYALELARRHGTRFGFIATAQAFDDEMRVRILRHRQERGSDFATIEAPVELSKAILKAAQEFDALIVDCLTLWLSNLLLAGGYDLDGEGAELAQTASSAPCPVILVTNEVGCGIVPENALARAFRDAAGRLNQQVAASATEVYWMAFGLPLRLK
jgi:adenosylcobinamide kinase/adenosylcobinamide-phosphate guanylyltransferase